MPRPPRTAASLDPIALSVYSSLAGRAAAAAKRRDGGEVFPFHVGDTWMEPAEGCRMEDLTVAEYPGMHRYTSPHGLPALLDAVVERVRERTGIPTERDEVLITAGATGGLGAVAGAIVEPGDEVLITAPYWPLIEGIVRSFHGTPVAVDFHGAADSAATAVAALERHRTERTVAVYWNTPHNPTGRVVPPSWLEAMAGWARRHGLWILADEVYEECQFEGPHAYTRPLAPERTFACHSFSKAYGMAGNRCGYVVGPAAAMTALRKVSTHTFYATPTAAQLAAARALAGPGDAWAAAARAMYEAIGRAAADRLGVERPRGSTFLFLDLSAQLDERGLAGFLERAADRGLLLAPGPSFGPYPRHARLCYTAAPPDVTRRGVEALAGLLGREAARTPDVVATAQGS
jgi:N-succinyldiaminopimelate aminotransferase